MLKKEDLVQFIGTTNYYRHPLCRSVAFTDGVHHLYTNGAAWLIDMVASHLQCHINLTEKSDGMVFSTFTRQGEGGRLEARADIGKPILFEQEVDFTDLPYDIQEIWAQFGYLDYIDNGKGIWIMMLPSEY